MTHQFRRSDPVRRGEKPADLPAGADQSRFRRPLQMLDGGSRNAGSLASSQNGPFLRRQVSLNVSGPLRDCFLEVLNLFRRLEANGGVRADTYLICDFRV